uniref:UBL3-like ubiquitin domain-containing protein n=1 Tax=Timema poppense TaxID=170557 RepID=A0A7R9H999_TIMPO|nr:unnamed protein product [Timema poppensis]
MCAQCCFGRASKMIFGPRFVVTDPRAGVSSKINLRLILVSGKTKEFLFSPSDSAGEIAQTVFDNWPEGNSANWPEVSGYRAKCSKQALSLCFLSPDWAEEAVARAEILRLIYQGRFLHSNVTLGALGLPFGKTTVMHLVPRENLPEPNSQGDYTVLLGLRALPSYWINARRPREGAAVVVPRRAVYCNVGDSVDESCPGSPHRTDNPPIRLCSCRAEELFSGVTQSGFELRGFILL